MHGDAAGSGVFFGQRSTTWKAGHPKTTPDPFRPIPATKYLAGCLGTGPRDTCQSRKSFFHALSEKGGPPNRPFTARPGGAKPMDFDRRKRTYEDRVRDRRRERTPPHRPQDRRGDSAEQQRLARVGPGGYQQPVFDPPLAVSKSLAAPKRNPSGKCSDSNELRLQTRVHFEPLSSRILPRWKSIRSIVIPAHALSHERNMPVSSRWCVEGG